MRKIPVGILGVSGYTGLELIKILLEHPVFEISYIGNSQGTQKLSEIHPCLEGIFEIPVLKANAKEVAQNCELVFLALPHKSSMEFAKEILEYGVKVVDLSADYRLKRENYEQNYQTTHIDPHNLTRAVYGLVEYAREEIKSASLIANPGCYPTATLLALLPFLPFLDQTSVFVDAKSGVSGAGKKLSDNTHYPNINENLFSYSPLSHRHQVEIEEKCEFFAGKALQVNFVPHLVPLNQGMLVSVFGRLKKEINPIEILYKRYQKEDFIRIRSQSVEIKNVRGTNFCDIFATNRGKDIYINAAIDNLLRGASSQAVVNANLMCGLKEDLCIPKIPR
ncbi:N-acetyl-gamma-glutamyl-phosphate reductase [Helicobacter sp. 12S02232-10]|uniref:N-acetyl-gamma-glutamyl-phosphate reductase n=1 Tax=Helicobacter sp. 12S02232-10 TaxID=1476197 RepID=UPI000BA6064C|nr:N-acetyl-gamma-glutamyl-phosphate reductase [Helicobacter sp. 12S02232-10]PAF47705.1 N-acetyl-gamma-glutamyl-phosphate reductase [Helicobacter sp. 12S02232-10]